MKSFKMRLSFMSILVASIAMFTGCGGKDASVTETSLPTLKALGSYQKDDYNTYPVLADIEQATGYKVVYDTLPQDRWEDKLNLIMASGDDYDIITILGTGRARYIDYANQGALHELTPLIDEYGDNIKKMVSKGTIEAAKVNGKLYAVPNGSAIKPGSSVINSALAMRTDLMEKAGLTEPETLEEFTEFLRQIKEKNPSGVANNIPLSITSETNVVGLQGAFGLELEWAQVDGKIVNRVERPEYREYLKYLNMLYNEGLLDAEFPTNKSANLNEKFTSGKAMIIPMNWADVPTIYDSLFAAFPDAKVEYMKPVTGPDGKRGFMAGGGGGGFDRITFIPKTSKKAEHAIQYINAKLSEDTFRLIAIGREGEHYTVENGEYFPILPKFFDERGQANNFMAGIDQNNYPDYWLARLRKDQRMYDAFSELNITKLKDYHTISLPMAPISPETANNLQSLKQIISDGAIKLVVGTESFDNYDKFIDKWKTDGGDRYTQEINDFHLKSQ